MRFKKNCINSGSTNLLWNDGLLFYNSLIFYFIIIIVFLLFLFIFLMIVTTVSTLNYSFLRIYLSES